MCGSEVIQNTVRQILLTRCGRDRLSSRKCPSSGHTASSLWCKLLLANKHNYVRFQFHSTKSSHIRLHG